ncbi:HK97 gp10 family phage protein [Cellvibrio sp. KY-GH-1]|uniref:HK97-gp10 family putative phage morphogenesis protein n=1 Tax=Cellvibrio sp. KY-GH-1 TaxID=2303332 RepID=UPI0012460ADF|nr:HK97-gp10 family putative phage morphogenesis protein [Cellvibrio sp. KY-GH-1]QEY15467.1 HK97 gp10 family phage protein [Cellvibrio sp. KY-GH-1]
MDSFDFKLQGVDSLQKKLKAVSDEIRYKGGRAGLRKAANFVRDVAKQNAERFNDPNTAESIPLNMAVRWSSRRFKTTGDLMFRVGVMGGAMNYADSRENRRLGRSGKVYKTGGSKKNPGGDTYYWRYKEFGTQHIPAAPFMRPALADNIDRVTSIVAVETDKAIDRALKRAGK